MAHAENEREFGGDEKEAAELESLYREGCLLLRMNKPAEALETFRRGMRLRDKDARFRSYVGYCTAAVEGKAKEGVSLCEKAVASEFYRPELYLNLGRAYLLAGNRRKAHQTFWKGYSLDKNNKELWEEIVKMGVRKPPIFKSLARGNILNRLTGKFLYTLRLR